MRRIKLVIVLAAVLSIIPITAVWAQRQVTPVPVGDSYVEPIILGPVDPVVTCQIGNLNAPAWLLGNFLLPPEQYKLVIRPWLTCPQCPIGIAVTRIHVILHTQEACDVTIGLDVDQAAKIEPGCYGPGLEWCNTGLLTASMPDSGLWDVSLYTSCPCLKWGKVYTLSLTIDDFNCTTGTVPDLVTDGTPTLCTNWNNYGTGWFDLLQEWPSWPGNLIIFAEANCCTDPVPMEQGTWGAIKSLYAD